MSDGAVFAARFSHHDAVTVAIARDVAHVDEVRVENQLVEVDRRAGEDSAEGLDEAFARGGSAATLASAVQRSAPAHIEIGCLTFQMLAAARSVSEDVVQSLAAEAAGDDHRQAQGLTQRFERALAEAFHVLDCLLRRVVVDAVLLGRRALGELQQREVRREHFIIFHNSTFFNLLDNLF